MRHIIILTLAISFATVANADHHPKSEPMLGDYMARHHLLGAQDCKDTKDGVGRLLGAAEKIFDDIKIHGDDKNKKWNKENWAKAAFFSELAANYSTVYQVWCKRHPHK